MLVNGIVQVLQHRQREGMGALPVDDIGKEFEARWKVSCGFYSCIQQTGESDVVDFLLKWATKVEVTYDGQSHWASLKRP
eukprot:1075351-Lingulodinium_polyedra.AAC.1